MTEVNANLEASPTAELRGFGYTKHVDVVAAGSGRQGEIADIGDTLHYWNGTEWIPWAGATPQVAASIAAGSTLGLQQQLLADSGQPGLTVLAVGYTNTGKVQGCSLGDGNVVEVYASGADFNTGNALYREFMQLGEPICFTGLTNGAIVTSTEGFYGMSEQLVGSNESPMPLLSYGFSFKETFLYAFRGSLVDQGFVRVVNGPLANTIKMTTGTGVTVLGQENIELDPWEFTSLRTNGNVEYIVSGAEPMMACVHASMHNNSFWDSRLVMPLTNDGITWPRSGQVSALYNDTVVDWWVRDNVQGSLNSGLGVSPGSPIDFDAAPPVGTGANNEDYEPNGATRVKARGVISAFSGADSAGLEASPLMPTKAMSQVVAQPFHIDDIGDGGNSGVAIASPYEGTARIYEWNDATSAINPTPTYTVPLTRSFTAVTSDDQNHPAAGLVSNDPQATNTLTGDLGPGVVIADVPITVVAQNGTASYTPTIRSQNGTTTTSIVSDDDETLLAGVTPATLRAEITQGTDGLLYKRVVAAGGVETWVVA